MLYFLLGTGYLGLALLSQREEMKCEFWAATTTESKMGKIPASKVILLNKSDNSTIKTYLAHCDGIIITVAPKGGASYEETYLQTALAVKEALVDRVRPFYLLYTSSTSVYGDHQGEWVDETSECLATSREGKVLIETEQTYLSCSSESVTPCILRLGGIYGPGRDLESRAKKLSDRELPGTGEEPINQISLDEIIRAIKFCCRHRLAGIYNLVDDDHPSRREFYGSLCRWLDIPPPSWAGDGVSLHGSNCKVSNKKLFKLYTERISKLGF